MLKPILELTGSTSWNIAYKRDLFADADENQPKGFRPIPRQNFLCQSNLMLIGVSSNAAKSTWYTGAYIEVNLLLGSVDSESAYPGVTQILNARIGLRRLTLLHWYEYEPKPYAILLNVPRWISQLSVEAYWYDGPQSDNYLQQLEGIKQGNAIAQTIDSKDVGSAL